MATPSSILAGIIPWTESLTDYSPWVHKELKMTKHTHNSYRGICERQFHFLYTHICIHINTDIYIYIYIERERERERDIWVNESHSVVSNSLLPHGLYSPPNSPGQNTGMGSLSLLQGICPTQGWNRGLPHFRWILYQLSQKRSPRILEWVAYPFSRGSA